MADEYADLFKDQKAIELSKAYLRKGDTVEFYEHIANSLMQYKPADPVHFCLEYVERLVSEHEAERTFPVECEQEEAPSSPTEDAAYVIYTKRVVMCWCKIFSFSRALGLCETPPSGLGLVQMYHSEGVKRL